MTAATKKEQILRLFEPVQSEISSNIHCDYSYNLKKEYDIRNVNGDHNVFPEVEQNRNHIVMIYDEHYYGGPRARIGAYLPLSTGAGFVTYHDTWRWMDIEDPNMDGEEFPELFEDELKQIRHYLATIEVNEILTELKRLGPDGAQYPESDQASLCDDLDNYLHIIDKPLRGGEILDFYKECMEGAKKTAVKGKNLLNEILNVSLDIDPDYYELTGKIDGREETRQYVTLDELKEDVENLKDCVKIDFTRVMNADIKILDAATGKPVFHEDLTFTGRVPSDLSEQLPDPAEVLRSYIYEAAMAHDHKSLNDFYKNAGYGDDVEEAIRDYEHCKRLLEFFTTRAGYQGLTFDDLLNIANDDNDDRE